MNEDPAGLQESIDLYFVPNRSSVMTVFTGLRSETLLSFNRESVAIDVGKSLRASQAWSLHPKQEREELLKEIID